MLSEFDCFRIKDKEKVYAEGHGQTNRLEAPWSLIKRGIGGVYRSAGQDFRRIT
jgi:hypothetical protein